MGEGMTISAVSLVFTEANRKPRRKIISNLDVDCGRYLGQWRADFNNLLEDKEDKK